MKLGFWEAIAAMVGTMIGAGVLGLPYVISKVGLSIGLVMLLLLGVAALILNLMLTEVVLRTTASHQLAGYAKKYLGVIPYRFETLAVIIGTYGGLTAYLIGEGKVLSILLGGKELTYSLFFFVIISFLLLFEIKTIKIFGLIIVCCLLVVVFAIVLLGGGSLKIENMNYSDFSNIFIPYGVILFAYGGAAAVVTVRQILRRNEKKILPAVLIGTLIPIVIYVIFTLVIVGVTGRATTEIATVGLGQALGPWMLLFGNLFAFFAMGSVFLNGGLILREFYQYDFHIHKIWAWLLVISVPLVLFLFVAHDFVKTMGVAGGLAYGITGITIVSLFWKAKQKGDRQPEFSLPRFRIIGSVLILTFILGMIYTLVTFKL
ncbi:MAG: Aromatic amino acid permease [Parcubacteria group bacterium GW2011_GWC2_39_14]|nr:MAG: Aromatic amino acid permease [Parcubacteria group bacterium GW2011_GWC2_39_14]KKR55511.1 MAG: Aromatic amino acid permease [Parcubacteria group bacterium GW2011_GWA2_40_23]